MRVALLSYRSDPCSGGQGVYVRNLSRELARLGHEVEVFSGPPYPQLDDGVVLTRVPSLDLYRHPDPFRTPAPRECRDLVDVLEYAIMARGGFPEPLTFSLRAARLMRRRARGFDVIHDNQRRKMLHRARPVTGLFLDFPCCSALRRFVSVQQAAGQLPVPDVRNESMTPG